VLPSMANAGLEQLKAFNSTAFVLALFCHGAISSLVGLLFAVLLPMLPSRRAAFWGSFFSPVLWSALVWTTLDLINPALNARIDWVWFVASQIAFGMVTGYFVHHSKMVETMQAWPLAARAGLEARDVMPEEEGDE
jgi:flagellar biosynthesis protein FliR